MKRFTFLLIFFFWCTGNAASQMSSVILDSNKVPQPPKWLQDGQVPNGKLSPLEAMLKAHQQMEFASCIRLGDSASAKFPQLSSWIARRQTLCAAESFEAGKPIEGTERILQKILRAPEAENNSARTLFRKEILRLLNLRLAHESRTNRDRFWSTFDTLTRFEPDLNVDEKAEMYRLAGEISFAQQHWETAAQFFDRSLTLKPNTAVQDRLMTVKSNLKASPSPAIAKQAPVVTPDIEYSAEEVKIFNRFSDLMRSGEWVAALDDGIEFLNNYPSSQRATTVSDRIVESLLTLAGKDDDRLESTRSTYLRRMERAHSERQLEWAKKCLARGFNVEALALSEAAYSSLEKSPKAGAALEVLVKSAWYSGQDGPVKKYAPILLEKSAGTSASAETLLILGLWEYSKQNYMNTVSHLERLIKSGQGESFELTAHYWLWRAHRKLNQSHGDQHADVLLTKFPFSYYGLRIRAEKAGQLTWDFKNVHLQTKIYLTKAQANSYNQARLLIESGWWEEAQAVLRELPAPSEPAARAIWGMHWAAALETPKAFQVLNESWDKVAELRNPPFVSTVFSRAFSPLIEKVSREKGVAVNLVRSLIKQESAFFFNAVSSSGALGLMQLMPATAKDVAKNLGKKNITVPQDVFRPEINVELGVTYIRDMLQQFNNHVPLALAAYNAGPGRLKRWLVQHPKYKNLSQVQTSDPDDDIWIEQMPWNETRGYVKSILRNAWIYELLAHGRVQVVEPFWKPLMADNK